MAERWLDDGRVGLGGISSWKGEDGRMTDLWTAVDGSIGWQGKCGRREKR
jgi:hypothetical protein